MRDLSHGTRDARPRPRVLHLCDSLLHPTETFVQSRLAGEGFSPVAAGWEHVEDGLAIPCPFVILSRRSAPAENRGLRRVLRGTVRWTRRRLDLFSLLLCSRPSIVHAHFGTVGLVAHRACRVLNIPLVVSFYGYDAGAAPRVPGVAARYRRMFRSLAAATAEGPALARTLETLGARRGSIYLLPLSLPGQVPDAKAPNVRKSGGPFRLLQIARLVDKKGIDTTLRVIGRVRQMGLDVRLVLGGEGPERPALEALARQLGIEEFVRFAGLLSREQVAHAFDTADAFIHPSHTAKDGDTEGGHPTVLLEAMARSLPVIATFHADIPTVVKHGRTGLLAPEGAVEALAIHVARLVHEPAFASSLGTQGRQSVLRRHDATRLVHLRERIYRQVLRSSGPPLWLPAALVTDPFAE